MYKRALAENDEAALAVACKDVDGRRDNRRVITRAEEAEALALIDKENVHPNKQVIRRTAIAVHQRHAVSLPPALSTRTQGHGQSSMLRQSVQTVNLLEGVGDVYSRHDRGYEGSVKEEGI